MEVYEFSLAIPLPDEPFAKGKTLGNIEVLAGAFAAALARAKLDGVELQHGMKARRGEYGKRKPKAVPPEPVNTAPMPFCRVDFDELDRANAAAFTRTMNEAKLQPETAPMPFCRIIHDGDTGAALAIPMGSYHD